jgi:hypothetical protein
LLHLKDMQRQSFHENGSQNCARIWLDVARVS